MLDARHFQSDLTDIMRIDPVKKRLPAVTGRDEGKPLSYSNLCAMLRLGLFRRFRLTAFARFGQPPINVFF